MSDLSPTGRWYLDVVFDGPPGPVAGRFVEVENEQGASVSVGEWVSRPDGYWALRLHLPLMPSADPAAQEEQWQQDDVVLDAADRVFHAIWRGRVLKWRSARNGLLYGRDYPTLPLTLVIRDGRPAVMEQR